MRTTVQNNRLTLQLQSDLTASKVNEILSLAREKVEESEREHYAGIELDLSCVQDIDSMGITFVVGLYKTAVAKDKQFSVTGLNTEITRLFRTMKLDEVFTIG